MSIFSFGSFGALKLAAENYDDIIYVMWDDINHIFKVICMPDYDIDKILEYINENVPLGVVSEVIVENKCKMVNGVGGI